MLRRRCPVCDADAYGVCVNCFEEFTTYKGEIPFDGLDSFWPMWRYNVLTAPAIVSAKNAGRRDVLFSLASAFAHRCERLLVPDSIVVTWVPSSKVGRVKRGYDQGKVIARSAARVLGVRSKPLLVRLTVESQHGKPRTQRLFGPRFTTRGCVPPVVLVVDDVVASGGSMRAAAEALRLGGAKEVHGACLAKVF